jgi:hypothetical protein
MVKKQPVTITSSKPNIFKPDNIKVLHTFDAIKSIQALTQQEQKRYTILKALLEHTAGAGVGILPADVILFLDTLLRTTCSDNVQQFKNLVISIIDIIHDADKSRTYTHCSTLPLFITTVCGIYGMSPEVYDYIRKNVVPITTKVLTMYVESSPPTRIENVYIYFARVVATYLRDTIAAGAAPGAAATAVAAAATATLAQNAGNAAAGGNPLVTALTQANALLYLQTVRLTDGSITINLIRDNTGISKNVLKTLQEAGVIFIDEVTGSVLLDAVSTPKSANFDTDLQTWVRYNPSIIVTNTLVPGNVTVNFTYFPEREAYGVSVEYPVGTTENFYWYPNIVPPGTGYPHVNCPYLPLFDVTRGTSPLPPNDTKNCAIKLAQSMGGLAQFNTAFTAAYPASVSYVGVPTNLTLEQDIVYKAMGDCSYILFNRGGSLREVTTSDIISALRLTEEGFQVIIGVNDGQQVFYTTINFNTQIVNKELEKSIANIFTSSSIIGVGVKKKVTNNRTLRIQGPVTRSTRLNTGIMTRSKNALLTHSKFKKIVNAFGFGLSGGQIQPVENPFDNNDNYFSNTLLYLAQLPEFCNFKFSTYQEDQHEKRVINSESEEMFMLLSNFKTIISNFGKKLEMIKQFTW